MVKHATINARGKKRTVSLDQLTCLRAIPHGDQIETGTITVTIEGEEPSELVLPVSMIEMLLEGIGAGPAAAPMEAEPMAAELEQVEAVDADDDPAKLDAKTVRKMIADALGAEAAKRTKADARTAQVHADAATILPPGYDYSVPWTQVALDAIALRQPALEVRARKLAADAMTDPVAEGRLRELLAGLRSDSPSGGGKLSTKGDGQAAPAQPAWKAPTMPARSTKQ